MRARSPHFEGFLAPFTMVTSHTNYHTFLPSSLHNELEPTNHLDLETTEALIEALQQFNGGVLLVSHDQHLLTKVCKDLYVVENGTVERLQGGMANEAFEAYKKAVDQGRR